MLVAQGARFGPVKRCRPLKLLWRVGRRAGGTAVAAGGSSSPGGDADDVGKQFRKELERRNISSVDDPKLNREEQRGGGFTPPPTFSRAAVEEPPSQLERSRALNSEGLEGLIPRGTELLKLGLSFFLAFGPFIVAVALAFALLYAVFGDSFVHTGQVGMSPPPYLDPQELLNEPTVDPMVPM